MDDTREILGCVFHKASTPGGYDYYSVPSSHYIGWFIISKSQIHLGEDARYTVGRDTPGRRYMIPIDEENCLRVPPFFFEKACDAYKKLTPKPN